LNVVAQQNLFNAKYRPQASLLATTSINASDIRNVPHNLGMSAGVYVSIPISDGHQRRLFESQNKIVLSNQQAYFSSEMRMRNNNLRNAKQQEVQCLR
jgi:hypothetical protein